MSRNAQSADSSWSADAASTADLMDRAKAGDRQAVEILFERHVPVLRQWAHGRLPKWARDLSDTGDLVQVTAMDAFRQLDRFEVRGDGALQAYLRQALMNRLRNELRRLARKPQPSVLESGIRDGGVSPLEAAMHRETLARYTTALDALSGEDRDAIVGRVEFGLSYRELADMLRKPSPDAARMTVARALLKLAEVLERD